MSTLPAGLNMDDNNIDSNYLQFVVGLLDDADNFTDLITRERADSITEFLRRERADSLTDFLKRERTDSISDFLPKQSDFLMRDRAFSWDLTMEEQMHSDKLKSAIDIPPVPTFENASSSSAVISSAMEKKRKIETKSPPATNTKVQKTSYKPPVPAKSTSKAASVPKAKVPIKQANVDQNVKHKIPPILPDGKPPKSMDQYNMDMSNIVPGAVLGHGLPPSLSSSDQPQTLTRFDPFWGHAGIMTSALHPLDSSSPRVGAYTKEERQVIIAKFRAKKMRRVWRKQIKYDCRKRLADTRPRVKGRFVSRKERESQEETKEVGETEHETGSGDGEFEDE